MIAIQKTINKDVPIYQPVFICDHCNEKIEDGSKANYEWDENNLSDIYHVHKICSRQFRSIHPNLKLWETMKFLPLYLATNLRVDLKRLKTEAREHNSLRRNLRHIPGSQYIK